MPISCAIPAVSGMITGLAVTEPCSHPLVIIKNPVEKARAIRVQIVMNELGLARLEIRNAEDFVDTLDTIPAIDYDLLQTRNILSLDSEKAAARFDGLQRIAVAYVDEVGLLDAGQPTPQLTKLVEEGVLAPEELEKLRKGAPMVMGGMMGEDLAKTTQTAPCNLLKCFSGMKMYS